MHTAQQIAAAKSFAEETAPGLHTSVALAPDRLTRAKAAYSIRRVNLEVASSLLCREISPCAGDLVLARVTQLGQHQHLESGDGRRARLWPGDEIVVAYGARYAPDQYEAYVPDDLSPCSLVAAGGIAARVHSRHASIRAATQINPIGLLADRHGEVLNVRHGALGTPSKARPAFTIAVVGSSMNAGKTTTAASLIAGLRRLGHRVGAAKVTGTGAGGDRWLMADAGASPVLDFTDAGYATTAGLPVEALELILSQLSAHVASAGARCLVIEVADGLLQAETAALLQSTKFAKMVDAVVFAAPDAMSVLAGADWLHKHGLPIVAISGVLTTSPLAMREAMASVDLPVHTAEELTTPHIVSTLLPILQRLSPGAAL
ncbi:MAG: DUF1611 domain-containing protein [Thiomonas sp.]